MISTHAFESSISFLNGSNLERESVGVKGDREFQSKLSKNVSDCLNRYHVGYIPLKNLSSEREPAPDMRRRQKGKIIPRVCDEECNGQRVFLNQIHVQDLLGYELFLD